MGFAALKARAPGLKPQLQGDPGAESAPLPQSRVPFSLVSSSNKNIIFARVGYFSLIVIFSIGCVCYTFLKSFAAIVFLGPSCSCNPAFLGLAISYCINWARMKQTSPDIYSS